MIYCSTDFDMRSQVHVAAKPSDCIARNAALMTETTQYSQNAIENLISRFEEPNGNARWDSPLVVFPWCDSLVAKSNEVTNGLAGKLEGLRVCEQHESPQKTADVEAPENLSDVSEVARTDIAQCP